MEIDQGAAPAATQPASGTSFAELFKSIDGQELREGSELEGIVEAIERDHVVINAGLKSESYIPIAEFTNEGSGLEVGVGDRVRVRIELTDNGQGQTVLSRLQVKRRLAWQKIKEAHENEEPINGVIKERVKGGFIVAIDGYRAFLPGSQVDVIPAKDLNAFLGLTSDFLVLKMKTNRGSVVVSRRLWQERQRQGKNREETLESLEEGRVVRGTVTSIAEYGAFIDIGEGLYGLLHITDLAWKRVANITDMVNIGDELDLKILSIDRKEGRISFGLKQMQQDPWEHIDRLYAVGDRKIGKVSNITDYGAFVELQDGIYGLVHTSEMDWSNKNVDPAQVVSENEEVEVMVLDIDKKKRRISLGIKQCKQNPWQEFSAAYRSGSVLEGTVRTITNFGMFVSVHGEIDGLVHMDNLSYTEKGEDALRKYSQGTKVKVVVLSVDVDEGKISLGVKQLEDGDFNKFADEHLRGTPIRGKVVEVGKDSASVLVGDGIRAVLPAREVSESRDVALADEVKIGEEREFMLVEIDKKAHTVRLSLKALERAERESILREMSGGQQEARPALGALLQAKMEESGAKSGAEPETAAESSAPGAGASGENDAKDDAKSGDPAPGPETKG